MSVQIVRALVKGSLVVGVLALLVAPTWALWLPGYEYRQAIIVDPGITPANLTDFPLLVKVTDPGNGLFANALPSGQDIVFTKADGVTVLPREIEYFSSTGTTELDAWVKTDLSSTAPTRLFMYYKGPAVANSTATWDASYRMVQHLEESGATPGAYRDSTANANDGTPYRGTTITDLHTAAGRIEGAAAFNGSNDSVDLGAGSSLNVGQGTWEAWVYPTSLTDHDYHTVAAKGYWSSWWFGLYQRTGRIQLWTAGAAHYSNGAVAANQWSHIAATWDGSTIKYYINGQPDSQTAETRAPVSNTLAAHLGVDYFGAGNPTLSYPFTGTIDEVRISDAARSAEWIKASYNNQSSPGAYQSLGPAWKEGMLSGWNSRQTITISRDVTPGALTDFPALIKITDPNNPVFRRTSSPQGYDIVFTDADGFPLAYQIESFSNAPGSENLTAWVKTPLSPTQDTTIYMYYGGPASGDPSSTATWDAHFKMVQHLDENGTTAGLYKDSTANGNNGSPYSGTTPTNLYTASGKIDGAGDFDGSNRDRIDVGSSSSLNVGQGTWEAWIRPASLTDRYYQTVVAKRYSDGWWFGLYTNTGRIQLWTAGAAHVSPDDPGNPNDTVPAGEWSLITATWDGSYVKFYLNGQFIGQVAESNPAKINSVRANIGMDYSADANQYQFRGLIDEVRISDIARSTDWIMATYRFLNSPGNYLTFSDFVEVPEPAAWVLLSFGLLALAVLPWFWRERRPWRSVCSETRF